MVTKPSVAVMTWANRSVLHLERAKNGSEMDAYCTKRDQGRDHRQERLWNTWQLLRLLLCMSI